VASLINGDIHLQIKTFRTNGGSGAAGDPLPPEWKSPPAHQAMDSVSPEREGRCWGRVQHRLGGRQWDMRF
jgi:hypothetical protein